MAKTNEIRLFLSIQQLNQGENGFYMVNRVTVVLIGSSGVGKTTLVKWLEDEGVYTPNIPMTDGIDIYRMVVNVTEGEVQFTFLDFAGQQVFLHMHKLFFNSHYIYLALVALQNTRQCSNDNEINELKVFLQIVADCTTNSTVILVPSRAGITNLDPDDEDQMKSEYALIRETVPVDAKEKIGFQKLQQKLVEYVLKNPLTTKKIPRVYNKLEEMFNELAIGSDFSLTKDELIECSKIRRIDLGGIDFDLAIDIFSYWGYIHNLGNGHIVLRSQELFDVLACLVTENRETAACIGKAAEGILSHEGSQGYSEELYLPTDEEKATEVTKFSIPPFLKLLYDSGIAYPLFDNKGTSLHKSLVPAMLHDECETLKNVPRDSSSLFCAFFPDPDSPLGTKIDVEILKMKFKLLPSYFLALLQVRLQFMAVIGGNWKKGCALLPPRAVGDDKKSFEEGTVLYNPDDDPNTLLLVISGKVRLTRSIVLLELTRLMKEDFNKMNLSEWSLSHTSSSQSWNQEQIKKNLIIDNTYISLNTSNVRIPIQILRVLVNQSDNFSETELSTSFKDLDLLRYLPSEFKELSTIVSYTENLLTAVGDDDASLDDILLPVSEQLVWNIPDFVKLLKVNTVGQKRDVKSLWLVFTDREDPPTFWAMPIAPTKVQNEWKLVAEAKVSDFNWKEVSMEIKKK